MHGAAYVALAGASLFLILLFLLHFIEPEFDPSWRFISEYSLGNYGWVMKLAFFSLAVSCAALFAAVKPEIETTGGKIGLAALLITAAGLFIAGVFDGDPVTMAKSEPPTTHGILHSIGATLGIPGLPIAAVLISRSLTRHSQSWLRHGRLLRWTAHLTWLSVLAMIAYVIAVIPKTGFVEGVKSGWFNRLVIVSYCLWLMTAAWEAMQRGIPAKARSK